MTVGESWVAEARSALHQLAVVSPVAAARQIAARRLVRAVDALRRSGSPYGRQLLEELCDAAGAGDDVAAYVLRLLQGRGVAQAQPQHDVRPQPVRQGIRYVRGPGC